MPDSRYDALTTFVHLGSRGEAIPLPVTERFWQDVESGALDRLGPGRLVSTYQFDADWGMWERHPAGEEFIVLISGAVEMVWEEDGGERVVALEAPGHFVLVPRGAWHTARTRTPSMMLFITAGEGTEHRR